MKKYLKFTLILFLCLNTLLNAQTKSSTIDSSMVRFFGWMAFKTYSKKENPRLIYLLKGSDTIKVYNDKEDYSDGGIKGGFHWRAFIYDSVKITDNLILCFKKTSSSETGDVFLYNHLKTKKLVKFTETVHSYTCNILPYYYKFISSYYKTVTTNEKVQTNANQQINTHIKTGNVIAKLLYGEKKNIPLINNKVYLMDSKGDTLKTTKTNEFGDFEFLKVNILDANIIVGNNEEIKNEKEIYLAEQNGTIISTLKKTVTGFSYRLLEVDITRLNEIETEEVDIKMAAFTKSTEQTITVTENIYYSNNEYKITPDISKILDITVNNLIKNNTYKLEIYSHTDSRGDDAANLELSNRRANAVLDYLASKGINRQRLTAKGMGETNIINRCGNGISCSEKEHELNRRTEFKFTK